MLHPQGLAVHLSIAGHDADLFYWLATPIAQLSVIGCFLAYCVLVPKPNVWAKMLGLKIITGNRIATRNLATVPVFWLQLVSSDVMQNMRFIQAHDHLVECYDDRHNDATADAFVIDPAPLQFDVLAEHQNKEHNFHLRTIQLPLEVPSF